MSLRIAIVGYGKMGRSVERLAREHDCEVVRIFRSAGNPNGEALRLESLSGVDVAIEFTTPLAAPENIRRLIESGVPVVTGTTGWFERISQIREFAAAKNGSVV
jgi:4-hydroxy-tetrahydrodipicolinate reductase